MKHSLNSEYPQSEPYAELAEKGKKSALPSREQLRQIHELLNKAWDDGKAPSGPLTHLEHTVAAIAKHKGGPCPLPEIQYLDWEKRIIQSDPQARIRQAIKYFGIEIVNRIDRSTKPPLSFYWIVADEHGRPKVHPVQARPEKTGRPVAQMDRATVFKIVPSKFATSNNPTTPPAERKENTAALQPALLETPMPPKRADSFLDYERGIK